jgi:hypothetical protein
MNVLQKPELNNDSMKTKTAIMITITALSTAACTFRSAVDMFWLFGSVSFIIAMILYPLRKKISPFIKRLMGTKDNRKFFFLFSIAFIMLTEEVFSQQITFAPAVETFKQILWDFSRITAGACGFYGLTRVAWLLVNEDRSAGTAFILAIIGFIAATIAIGLLD